MAYLEQTILDLCFQWVTANVPNTVPVIFKEQSAPRPTKRPYITIKPLGGTTRIGSIDELRQPSSAVFQLQGVRSLQVSIESFGATSRQLLSNLIDSIDLQSNIDLFAVANVSISSHSEARDLTTLLENKFEERAQMDVTLILTSERDEPITYIENAPVVGELDS